MKLAWIILLISACTDFIISAGTSLNSAMLATGHAALPSTAVLVVVLVGAFVQFARTIQNALKSDQTPAGQLFPRSSEPKQLPGSVHE